MVSAMRVPLMLVVVLGLGRPGITPQQFVGRHQTREQNNARSGERLCRSMKELANSPHDDEGHWILRRIASISMSMSSPAMDAYAVMLKALRLMRVRARNSSRP